VRVLIIDNYDSFTYNLVQYLGELGAEVEVVRNDAESIAELQARSPDRVVISPGPCTPNEAGVSLEAIKTFAEAGIPVLGVCLGHQALGQVFGGEVVRGTPTHGKTALVEHDGKTIYAGVDSPIEVARYHSLVVAPESLPEVLEVSATTQAPEGEVIMGLRHKQLPAEGVQFHPESILSEHGHALLKNFLER
jgi:anthranilate synthase/aminodeoxychorismate synthase-like glutamine amidotransferase